MGLFLNMGNENFDEFSQTDYFVDKSELINVLLQKDITEKFIRNSRARRFGKSMTADMLVAYFSRGADSRELFEPLKCVKDALFCQSMNAEETQEAYIPNKEVQAVFYKSVRKSKNDGLSRD